VPSAKLSLASAGAALAGLALAAGAAFASAPAAGASVAPAAGASVAHAAHEASAGPNSVSPSSVILFFWLNNVGSSYCLTERGNHTVTQQPCAINSNPHQPEYAPGQSWAFVPQGGGYYTIENVNWHCLAVSGSSKNEGAPMVAVNCNPRVAAELWKVRVVKSSFPYEYGYINRNSGQYLGITKGSKSPGAAADQWKWANVPNQKWYQGNSVA
jgi:hypothetical protein